MSEALLRASATGLVILVLLSLLLLLGHALWASLRGRVNADRLARGRAAMYGMVAGEQTMVGDLAVIRALPASVQDQLLIEVSLRFGGSMRERLHDLARDVGALERSRHRLRSRLWWRRLYAARVISSVGGCEREMTDLLSDPHPIIRAQAAEWGADHPSAEVLSRLLELLSDPAALSRFTVQDSLLRLGPAAAEPLLEYLSTHGGREVLPALEVAAARPDPTFAGPAIALCRDSYPPVRAVAARLLGAVGGGDAVEALIGLMSDEDAAVRASACRAIGRLGHWPAAPRLAEMLRDSAWEVRRAAGLSLRHLGSPGTLLLRRARSDADPFAADMAELVLSIPAAAERGL